LHQPPVDDHAMQPVLLVHRQHIGHDARGLCLGPLQPLGRRQHLLVPALPRDHCKVRRLLRFAQREVGVGEGVGLSDTLQPGIGVFQRLQRPVGLRLRVVEEREALSPVAARLRVVAEGREGA
jgi:hypothetical protein